MKALSDTNALTAKAKEVSRLLRGLSHPARLKILCRLSEGHASVHELQDACGLSQAQTSQFLARLRHEGHVTCRRDGQHIYYSLADSRTTALMNAISGIYCKAEAEAETLPQPPEVQIQQESVK